MASIDVDVSIPPPEKLDEAGALAAQAGVLKLVCGNQNLALSAVSLGLSLVEAKRWEKDNVNGFRDRLELAKDVYVGLLRAELNDRIFNSGMKRGERRDNSPLYAALESYKPEEFKMGVRRPEAAARAAPDDEGLEPRIKALSRELAASADASDGAEDARDAFRALALGAAESS